MAADSIVEAIASWSGARDNGKGDWWMKVTMPQTETPQALRMQAYYAGKEVWAFLRLQDGSMHEICHGPFNGCVQSPQHWDYKLSVRADMQNVSIDGALIRSLKDTSFVIRLCTVDDLQVARINDVVQQEPVSYGERQDNDKEDLTADEYAL